MIRRVLEEWKLETDDSSVRECVVRKKEGSLKCR
jgi:hypothetical protein